MMFFFKWSTRAFAPAIAGGGVRRTAKSANPSELISVVYEAAVDGEAWARLPRLLADYVKGETCAIYSTAQGDVNETVTHGLDEAAADYVGYYHRVEPWGVAGWYEPSPGPLKGWDRIDPSSFAETEYYRDFARHWGMYHVMGGSWPVTAEGTFTVAIHRPRNRRDFGPNELEGYGCLLPHMQRMIQLRRRLSEAERTAQVGFAAVDALAFAAVICTAGGGVVFANAAARVLSADKGSPWAGRRQASAPCCRRKRQRSARS
jgi:hypothetical protein